MTHVDLSHSAHHVTTEFVLPVLEDADSIQITLGQIMRMIVPLSLFSVLHHGVIPKRPRFHQRGEGSGVDLLRG